MSLFGDWPSKKDLRQHCVLFLAFLAKHSCCPYRECAGFCGHHSESLGQQLCSFTKTVCLFALAQPGRTVGLLGSEGVYMPTPLTSAWEACLSRLSQCSNCMLMKTTLKCRRPPVTNAVSSVTKSPQGIYCPDDGAKHPGQGQGLPVELKSWFPEALLLSPAVEVGLVISMSESGTNLPKVALLFT